MPWPPKIALFGKGSGKMTTPSSIPDDIVKRFLKEKTQIRKREFMQAAVLEMLPVSRDLDARAVVARAEQLYILIEEKTHNDAKEVQSS